MYARLVQFAVQPGHEAAAHALADDLPATVAEQPGCVSVAMFGDDSDGHYGLFVLWETQEHANQAASIMRPKLDQHLAGHLTEPPQTRLFPVLAHP
jgi:quinol monooxygenase YgiN